MITTHVEAPLAACDFMYSVATREGTPYLSLNAVQFVCKRCYKHAYIDFTLVPIHTIPVLCSSCHTALFTIPEDAFERELVATAPEPQETVYEIRDAITTSS